MRGGGWAGRSASGERWLGYPLFWSLFFVPICSLFVIFFCAPSFPLVPFVLSVALVAWFGRGRWLPPPHRIAANQV